MSLSRDLLELADFLARREPKKPKQASLRRSISSAYYALFHLLIEEAIKRWSGSQHSRYGLARAFEHSDMEKASKAFKKSDWEGFDGANVQIPRPLQEIAVTFLNLQEARHQADYSPTIRLLRTNVQAQISQVRLAFQLWAQVKTTTEADYYLMALLTGNRRRH